MNPFTASTCSLYCSVFLFLVVCLFCPTLVSASSNISTTTELPGEQQLFNSLADKKVYNKNLRPNHNVKPVEVHINIRVENIYSVSENNMDITLDLSITQFWNDPRLVYKPASNKTTDWLVLTSEFAKLIWIPDTYIAHTKSLSAHLSISSETGSKIFVNPIGYIFYTTKITTTVNCPMDLWYFPVDKQKCQLVIKNDYSTKDLINFWRFASSSIYMNPEISLSNFNLTSYHNFTTYFTNSYGTYKNLICEMHFERSLGHYINQIYVPSFLIVVISWIPFWLDRNDNHARVGLGVTTVLTITTLITSTNESLPKVSYVKAIDIYLVVCFCMVFLSLIEFATIGWFESMEQSCQEKKEEEKEKQVMVNFDDKPVEVKPKWSKRKTDTAWIDKVSRVLFPTVFITFNVIYIGTLICIKNRE